MRLGEGAVGGYCKASQESQLVRKVKQSNPIGQAQNACSGRLRSKYSVGPRLCVMRRSRPLGGTELS